MKTYLIDMTKIASENDGYRYAVTGVDIFSKYGWAMPIKTKQPHDVLIGLKEVLDKIGIPEKPINPKENTLRH